MFWCVVSLSIFTICAVFLLALQNIARQILLLQNIARQNIAGYLYSIHALFVLYFALCDNSKTYCIKQFFLTINCSENPFEK